MPCADRDHVERFRRREQGALRSLLCQGLEDGPLTLARRGPLQVEHPVERGNFQGIEDVAGADQEQDAEPVREVVEEAAPRAHRSGERAFLVPEREVDEKDLRRRGGAFRVSLLHPQYRPIDRVDQQAVLLRPFGDATAGGIQDGPHVERAWKRRLVEIAGPREGSVTPFRCRGAAP